MKMKYLFHGLLASILLITACQEPDDLVRSDSENINILSVKGSLISDADKQYDAIVDEANGTITVQVPYYISDTEKNSRRLDSNESYCKHAHRCKIRA